MTVFRLLRSALLAAALVTCFASQGLAAAFTINFSGFVNTPEILITNLLDDCELVGFEMGIGDASREFDFVSNIDQTGGVVETLVAPNTSNDLVRSQTVEFTFTGFDTGDTFSFRTDIDPIGANDSDNYTQSLLNGYATATFEGGKIATVRFDAFNDDTTTFEAQVVPVPAAVWLLGAGLAGVVGLRRRS